MTDSGSALLELDRLGVRFGGVTALSDVSLTVETGQIFGLIGPNGAGKTSAFNLITGVYQPSEGDIRLEGKHLPGHKPHDITRMGVARTFQNIRLFPEMTGMENVMVGADARHRSGLTAATLGLPLHRREQREGEAITRGLLAFAEIPHAADETARHLPYGEQRRLEIARALATQPRLLLLDEPAAGMNPAEKQSLQSLIVRIRERGVTVLLIEHDMSLVMGMSDRVAVLDFGRKIAEGTPRQVQSNPAVIQAYLGTAEDEAAGPSGRERGNGRDAARA